MMAIALTMCLCVVVGADGVSAAKTAKSAKNAKAAKKAAKPEKSPEAKAAEQIIRRQWKSLIREQLLAGIPNSFEDQKNWGKTSRRFDGLKFERDGGKLKIRERTKEVNHGLWSKYNVWLEEPEKNLTLDLRQFRWPNNEKLAFQVHVTTPLAGNGKVERWEKGIKLIGFGVSAKAAIAVTVDIVVGVKWGGTAWSPTLELTPRVVGAATKLTAFDLQRAGILDGKMAHEIGDEMRDAIQRMIDRQQPKVVDKANQAIARKTTDGKIVVALADKLPDLRPDWMKSLLGSETAGQADGKAATVNEPPMKPVSRLKPTVGPLVAKTGPRSATTSGSRAPATSKSTSKPRPPR